MRGRVTIRPWRVGVMVDTASAEAVREAIANLSGVWGGLYMPIFDIGTPIEEVEKLGRQHDVDSLYADVAVGELGDLLREPGWRWAGRGPWGPFGEEHGFRKGLLPTRAFLDGSQVLVHPTWESDDPADLVLAATWGLVEERALQEPSAAGYAGPRSAPYGHVLATARPVNSILGMLQASTLHVGSQPRAYLGGHCGVYVIRPDHPPDVVEFWNMRSYGTRIIGVPAEGADDFLTYLLAAPFPLRESTAAARTRPPVRYYRSGVSKRRLTMSPRRSDKLPLETGSQYIPLRVTTGGTSSSQASGPDSPVRYVPILGPRPGQSTSHCQTFLLETNPTRTPEGWSRQRSSYTAFGVRTRD